MFVFNVLLLLTSTISVCSSLNNSQSQFWCNLSGVERCVSNFNECSCLLPNQTYCPSNNSCQDSQTFNASLCWSNVSCDVVLPELTTVTVYSSTASGGAGFIEPTTVTASGGAGFIVSTASSLASASSSKTSDGHVSTTPASTTFHPLDTDYTPIIISIAAGFGCFIAYVCFMCIVHSWWLKRNKFTGVNSTPLKEIEKRKRKEELKELRRQRKEMEAREPSKFDMGYRKPQKVNERALANYDWARTSYLPGMLEPSNSQPNPVEITPKLICDDEDTDFDNPNELGDENKAYESGQEHEDDSREVTTPASLFSPIEVEPQEPVMVEPEIFESMEEIPRAPPDGDVADRDSHSQDYFNMMGRF